LAARIRAALPAAELELVKGKGGNFIVDAGDQRLWDKRRMGDAFPDEDALVARLQGLP
jgi:predicted Rdx family selenoprotein